jgi:hypothetical protein
MKFTFYILLCNINEFRLELRFQTFQPPLVHKWNLLFVHLLKGFLKIIYNDCRYFWRVSIYQFIDREAVHLSPILGGQAGMRIQCSGVRAHRTGSHSTGISSCQKRLLKRPPTEIRVSERGVNRLACT